MAMAGPVTDLAAFLSDPSVSEKERRARRINAERGMYSQPFDYQASKKKQEAAANAAKRKPKKWKPKLRYAKTKQGISIVFHLPNREQRRHMAQMQRCGYYDRSEGKWITGWRTKRKRELRRSTARPIKVRA